MEQIEKSDLAQVQVQQVQVVGRDRRGDMFAAMPIILDNGKKTLAVVGPYPCHSHGLIARDK